MQALLIFGATAVQWCIVFLWRSQIPQLPQQDSRITFRRRTLLSFAVLAACTIVMRWAGAWDERSIAQKMQQQFGAPGLQRLQAWFQLLQKLQGRPVNEQLRAVNDFWNQQVLASQDINIWREADYWATPFECLGKGAGDCEDFVLGKYFSLLRLGVPARQMRLIYVRARTGGLGSTQSIAHMVMGFYDTPTGDPRVLDNLVPRIHKASQRSDLTPVFSFDAESIYVNGARSASSERINRWQGLLARMRQEGFDV